MVIETSAALSVLRQPTPLWLPLVTTVLGALLATIPALYLASRTRKHADRAATTRWEREIAERRRAERLAAVREYIRAREEYLNLSGVYLLELRARGDLKAAGLHVRSARAVMVSALHALLPVMTDWGYSEAREDCIAAENWGLHVQSLGPDEADNLLISAPTMRSGLVAELKEPDPPEPRPARRPRPWWWRFAR